VAGTVVRKQPPLLRFLIWYSGDVKALLRP
jgi:hypothetical protein